MAAHNPAFSAQDEEKVMNGELAKNEDQQDAMIRKLSVKVEEENVHSSASGGVIYSIDDVPPWYLCLILGLQHYLTMFGGTVTYPYLLAPKLCIRENDPARGYIISTTFFVSGIATFIQSTFGVRLPIVQGSTFAFLVPTLAILGLPRWQCPESNTTLLTENEWEQIWQSRMREVQGAIIGASLFEVAIGFTGLMGVLLCWISPLAIAPTVGLVGLSLFQEAASSASGHWGIAFFTIALLIIFSQYARDVSFPRCSYNRTDGLHVKWFPLFKLFPVLLTIIISWAFSAILTEAGVFSDDSRARTDRRLETLYSSPWFRIPYPGQWGTPTWSTGAVFGVLAGVLASAIESVGDYYACARLAGAAPPPSHAINRGICVEGIGCIISGVWGSGGGVTSYSENIGAIGITKVGSRRVIQVGALLMIVFGMLGKFGALFVTIPEPIVGGIFCVMFSVIAAVGLSNIQFIDLNSSRNLFILGFALFMGLCVPRWLNDNPGVIRTGNEVADQIITVLLSTSMFVGGVIGFVLDNSIPGTDEERGIKRWRHQSNNNNGSSGGEVATTNSYALPFFMPTILKVPFFRYIPISPTYKEEDIIAKVKGFRRKKVRNQTVEITRV